MSKGTIFVELKSLVPQLFDKNGETRVMPIGKISNLKLGDRKLKFLEDLVLFLRDTSFLKEHTKEYIFDEFITISGLYEKMKIRIKNEKELLSPSGLRNSIYYDRIRLEKEFGNSLITDVLYTSKNIEQYEIAINVLRAKFDEENQGLRKNLALQVNPNTMSNELSDVDFRLFLDMISPYTRRQMGRIEETIPETVSGYFNYLLSARLTKDTDRDRLSELKEYLSDSFDDEEEADSSSLDGLKVIEEL